MIAFHLFHISFWFLKVPSLKWFFRKSMPKNPYLKAYVIILRDQSSFQKQIFLKGWKFNRICILCFPFGLVFVPPPLTKIKRLSTVLSGMDSVAKPQRNLLLFCRRIQSILGNFFCKILDFIIDIKIKSSKLLILEQ